MQKDCIFARIFDQILLIIISGYDKRERERETVLREEGTMGKDRG